jgi:hypothetical protein
MPLRAMPEIGAEVELDFLGATVAGTVRTIEPGGHQLEVETEDGERLTFRLNRATAIFTADGLQTGARLRFTPR